MIKEKSSNKISSGNDREYKWPNSPDELSSLNLSELKKVSEEIRRIIIETVSKNGGHLASSLGTVELTVALHYLFNSPKDKIVWDVGHQAYAHKILTGRKDRFSSLREAGGISGFPKRCESEHDAFGAGHSGTSISAALGISEAFKAKNKDRYSIAVIGDGSMTGGMPFEALNNAGSLKSNIIVVLNDNEMSISPNVGAFAHYLTRIITDQRFNRAKEDVENFLGSLPGLGQSMYKGMEKLEDAFKSLFVPGMIFEELGFKYLGPIDGHDFKDLTETFEAVKEFKRPILVHVCTKKGKGFKAAEKDSPSFHSAPPFDPETGERIKGSGVSYTSVFGKTLLELAENDKKIVAITAAMREGTGLQEFSDKFPSRFYDVGIAEEHAVTFAAGLATEGLKPVVAIYSTFLQRAYDQIFHDVCLQELPVVFALDRAGIVGNDGPTHHGLFDLSYLRMFPKLVFMAPKDECELAVMLEFAIALKKPVAIRYPRGSGIGCDKQDTAPIEIGKGEILREGEDLLIVAIGSTVYPALSAAESLSNKGIDAAVVNARFINPLDTEMICKMAKKTGRVMTVEENQLAGGFGSSILEMLSNNNIYNIKTRCIGIPDTFVEQGTQQYLRSKYKLDKSGIANEALMWMGKE